MTLPGRHCSCDTTEYGNVLVPFAALLVGHWGVMPAELAFEIIILLKQPVILLFQALHMGTPLAFVLSIGVNNVRCITRQVIATACNMHDLDSNSKLICWPANNVAKTITAVLHVQPVQALFDDAAPASSSNCMQADVCSLTTAVAYLTNCKCISGERDYRQYVCYLATVCAPCRSTA